MAHSQEHVSRYRQLKGPLHVAERVILTSITCVGIVYMSGVFGAFRIAIFSQQYLGLFIALVLASVFLIVPPSKRARRDGVPWYDLCLALIGLTLGLYVAIAYPQLVNSLARISPERVVLGALAILLVLEATRRVLGWILVVVVVILLLYARFTYLVPGVLTGREVSLPRLCQYLYLDTNALLGSVVAVGATVILAYVLFGQVLLSTGGGKFLNDFALTTMGRFRGGAAKTAVVASSLFGTISGSAVSNVLTTGPVTIPMMKSSGFPSILAGATEAISSTGGQIMPPVMGAGAFIMAEFLGIPYAAVAKAAAFPAILFYLALFVQIDRDAARLGMGGIPSDKVPALMRTLARCALFFVPFLVLVLTLFVMHLQAEKAGIIATASVIAVALVKKESRHTLARLPAMFEQTARSIIEMGAIAMSAGLVVGVVALTGLGPALSMILIRVGEVNILLLLLLAACMSLVMGMGMPTTTCYILLSLLVAPTLVQLGILPLPAHLFIFYFGCISMVTPPVAFAAFSAASIANADFMRVGWTATRLGFVAYLLPFVFVFSPGILLLGSIGDIVIALVTATLGTILVGIGLVGYLYRHLPWMERGLLILGGIALFLPHTSGWTPMRLAGDITSIAVALLVTLREWRRHVGSKQNGAKDCNGGSFLE